MEEHLLEFIQKYKSPSQPNTHRGIPHDLYAISWRPDRSDYKVAIETMRWLLSFDFCASLKQRLSDTLEHLEDERKAHEGH